MLLENPHDTPCNYFNFYLRYMVMNVKYSQGYCKYNSEIPSFLVNRPRILVLHCIETIFAAKDGCWYLKSLGDSETMCHCECPDWQKW